MRKIRKKRHIQLVVDDVKDSCRRVATSIKNLLHVELDEGGIPKIWKTFVTPKTIKTLSKCQKFISVVEKSLEKSSTI